MRCCAGGSDGRESRVSGEKKEGGRMIGDVGGSGGLGLMAGSG